MGPSRPWRHPWPTASQAPSPTGRRGVVSMLPSTSTRPATRSGRRLIVASAWNDAIECATKTPPGCASASVDEGRRLLGQGGQVVRPRGAAEARAVQPDQRVARQQPGDGIPGVRGHPAAADQDHRRPAARLDDHVDVAVTQQFVVLRRGVLSHGAAPARARRPPNRLDHRSRRPADGGSPAAVSVSRSSTSRVCRWASRLGGAPHDRVTPTSPGSADPCSGSIRSTATRWACSATGGGVSSRPGRPLPRAAPSARTRATSRCWAGCSSGSNGRTASSSSSSAA